MNKNIIMSSLIQYTREVLHRGPLYSVREASWKLKIIVDKKMHYTAKAGNSKSATQTTNRLADLCFSFSVCKKQNFL